MSNHLKTELRQQVGAAEPPYTVHVDAVLRRGRRKLLRRRLAAATGAVAAGVISVTGVNGALSQNYTAPDRIVAAPATALPGYDADQMPQLITDAVADALPSLADRLSPDDIVALDSQGHTIGAANRDKASDWVGTFELGPDHELVVTVSHGGSETEGNAEEFCEAQLGSGYALTCSVDVAADGSVLVTKTWSAVVEAGTGELAGVRHGDAQDGQHLVYGRDVTARRGDRHLITASERVQAQTLADAEARWVASTTALRDIVDTQRLEFPRPPTDPDSGCAWIVPREADDYEC